MSDATPYRKPLPRIDEESRAWWEALVRHELYVQECRACGVRRLPPRALCPTCLRSDTAWVRSAGAGTVYSYTVTFQNQAPGFREALPYVLALVELDEGPRLMTNVIECDPAAVRIGMRVAVAFTDVAPDVTLPLFRPA